MDQEQRFSQEKQVTSVRQTMVFLLTGIGLIAIGYWVHSFFLTLSWGAGILLGTMMAWGGLGLIWCVVWPPLKRW